MAELSCVPVDTSSRTSRTALVYLILPVAPATESKASINGTPAAKVVDSVRAKRANTDCSTMSPTMGILNMNLSTAVRKAKLFSIAFLNRIRATTMPITICSQ